MFKFDADGKEEIIEVLRGIAGNAGSIEQTLDGGYVIVGGLWGDNTSLLLMKIDSNASEEWIKSFEYMSLYSNGSYVDVTTDGGFIITGRRQASSSYDIWLIYTDSEGNPKN